jgi:uncharacterized membrane protein YhaH (DUF805 family)
MDNQYFAHYLAAFKPYANFEGRTTRPQYWYFVLFNIIISLVLWLIDGAVFGQWQSVLGGIYGLVTIIPSLAIAARRLHDIGKSGWWQLIGIIPVIGWIWIIVLLATDTVAGKNQYDTEPTTPVETPTTPAA